MLFALTSEQALQVKNNTPSTTQLRGDPNEILSRTTMAETAQGWLEKRQNGLLRILIDDVDLRNLDPQDHKCCICQELMASDSDLKSATMSSKQEFSVRLAPCGHIFGISCIMRWLYCHESCPICRAVVLPLPRRELKRIFALERWRSERRQFYETLMLQDWSDDLEKVYAFLGEQTNAVDLPDVATYAICHVITRKPESFSNGLLAAYLDWVEPQLRQLARLSDPQDLQGARKIETTLRILRTRYLG